MGCLLLIVIFVATFLASALVLPIVFPFAGEFMSGMFLLWVSLVIAFFTTSIVSHRMKQKSKIEGSLLVFDKQLDRAAQNYNIPHEKVEEERALLLKILQNDALSSRASAELNSFIEFWKISREKEQRRKQEKTHQNTSSKPDEQPNASTED